MDTCVFTCLHADKPSKTAKIKIHENAFFIVSTSFYKKCAAVAAHEKHSLLLALIKQLCIYLCGRYILVSEHLADGVYIHTQIEHHNCKGVSAAVECDMFVYTCVLAPLA